MFYKVNTSLLLNQGEGPCILKSVDCLRRGAKDEIRGGHQTKYREDESSICGEEFGLSYDLKEFQIWSSSTVKEL